MTAYLVDTVDADATDPHTPIFWETVHWLATQGRDISEPDMSLPEPSIGVMVAELSREVALRTPTQLMPVVGGD